MRSELSRMAKPDEPFPTEKLISCIIDNVAAQEVDVDYDSWESVVKFFDAASAGVGFGGRGDFIGQIGLEYLYNLTLLDDAQICLVLGDVDGFNRYFRRSLLNLAFVCNWHTRPMIIPGDEDGNIKKALLTREIKKTLCKVINEKLNLAGNDVLTEQYVEQRIKQDLRIYRIDIKFCDARGAVLRDGFVYFPKSLAGNGNEDFKCFEADLITLSMHLVADWLVRFRQNNFAFPRVPPGSFTNRALGRIRIFWWYRKWRVSSELEWLHRRSG